MVCVSYTAFKIKNPKCELEFFSEPAWILLHNIKQKFPLQSLISIWLLFWYFGSAQVPIVEKEFLILD